MLKVIIGIIVFIIWGVGALANLAKKQNRPSPQSQAEMERAMREQMEEARRREAAQALGQMGGPAMRPPPMPPPPVLPRQQQQQQRMRPHGPVVPPMRTLPQGMPQRTPARRQPPTAPPARRPMPQVPPSRPVAQPKKKPQQQRRRQAPQPVMPLEPEPLLEPLAGQLVPGTPDVAQSEIGAGSTPASPARRRAAQGPAIRLTAQGLRQQFILTEILQPPLALRDRSPGA
jgi:hypothetical protein